MIKKDKIQSVVNCFETGSIKGDYGNVSIYSDGKNGSRQITFGKSQTTEQSHLKELLEQYIANKGIYAKDISGYLSKLNNGAVNDSKFINILKQSGKDPIMQKTQDVFFDKTYWDKAFKWATDNKFTENLSILVIYDSFIHSGGILDFLRNKFPEKIPSSGGDEKRWIVQYVAARLFWLQNHSNKILRNTVYRMTDIQRMIKINDWNLDKPIIANDVKVP